MAPSTAQPPAPAETPIETPAGSEHTLREPGWDVLVWNDPITLMSYVVLVFRRLFGYDFETATKLMLQVHHEGKAVVATQPREQAEVSVSRLHGFGLQATMGRG
jgi:ATP-dependent Clp protease adaptor protein ClpS